jgi:hypothetical protein
MYPLKRFPALRQGHFIFLKQILIIRAVIEVLPFFRNYSQFRYMNILNADIPKVLLQVIPGKSEFPVSGIIPHIA